MQYGSSITPGNEDYVHHMLLYNCNGLRESDLGPGRECGVQSDGIKLCQRQLIAGWGIGGSVS